MKRKIYAWIVTALLVLALLPDFTITANENTLRLGFPGGWLEDHPLTARELELEQDALRRIGIKLKIR